MAIKQTVKTKPATVAIASMLSKQATMISKVADDEGRQAAEAFCKAFKSHERVKAFLSGLVDDKLLVS
jgi:hypothetical protein